MGKRKLTKQEKAAKRLRKPMFMTVFIRGKQKSVRRPPMIEGLEVDEFIRRNADPIWLHQNEMWELIETEERVEHDGSPNAGKASLTDTDTTPF
jgi:hypothetical protein